jgi:hypothetical protein
MKRHLGAGCHRNKEKALEKSPCHCALSKLHISLPHRRVSGASPEGGLQYGGGTNTAGSCARENVR